MRISRLNDMFTALKGRSRKRLVLACANDSHSISAVAEAVKMELVDATLVGDREKILSVCEEEGFSVSDFEIVNEAEDSAALSLATLMVNQGKGDMIMKGLVSTDKYMRAILNKEFGLLPPGAILSHVSLMESVSYHKLLVVGDVAIIPLPGIKEKTAISNYLLNTARALGIEKPKLAALAATEQVLDAMPATTEAAVMAKMGKDGEFGNALVDGPMALDVAIDRESALIKGISSEVAGDADCLLFPNIEAGNSFYKYHTKLAGGQLAAIVAGAKVPAILSSRGDSIQTKLYSIALAALLAGFK